MQRVCSLGSWRGFCITKCKKNKKQINLNIFVSSKVILASGYYAAFRVTLVAKALEGLYDGAIHITTDYEVDLMFFIGHPPKQKHYGDVISIFSPLRY